MLLVLVVVVLSRQVTQAYNYVPATCNPTLGYCANFFNLTKLPNKFSEDNYSRVISKLTFL